MSTHIEDIEKDDYGMKKWLRDAYIYFTGGEKRASKNIAFGGNVTLGVIPTTLLSKDICNLIDILPMLSPYNERDRLNSYLVTYDADNFVTAYFNFLKDELEAVFLAYKKGELEIIGDWRGYNTFVEPTEYLRWAQSKGYAIPPEFADLVQGEKGTVEKRIYTIAPREKVQRKDELYPKVQELLDAEPDGLWRGTPTLTAEFRKKLPEGTFTIEDLRTVIRELKQKEPHRISKGGREKKK